MMNKKHHCNNCPHWYVTKKGYPSGFYNITFCKKYNEQIYYLAGEENQTPHPCNMCEKQGSYVSYINQEVLDVKRVTERLTEDFYDDMQKITRHCVKSDNIGLNCGADDFQYVIDRLAEYEIAEEEGRLLVLPCVIGDTVWMVHQELTDAFSIHFTISEMNVVELRGNRMNPIWFVIDGEYGRTSFSPSEIGKTIFLIREEAEKKLKEMKRENGSD